MNRKQKYLLFAVPLLFLMLSTCLGNVSAYTTLYSHGEGNVVSPYTDTAPSIDGKIEYDEWQNSSTMRWFFEPTSNHPDDFIYIMFQNDEEHLYIAVDVLCDNTSDPSDELLLIFHFNRTDFSFPGDMWVWLYRYRQDSFMVQPWHKMASDLVDEQGNTKVSWMEFAVGFGTSFNRPTRWHTMFELRLDIDINATEFDVTKWFNASYEEPLTRSGADYYPELPTGNNFSVIFGGSGTLTEWMYPDEDWANMTLSLPPEAPEPEPEAGDGNEFTMGEILIAASIGAAGLVGGIMVAPMVRSMKRSTRGVKPKPGKK